MLTISNLSVSYGAIRALNSVSLEVPQGKLVALVGANGAGKSTLLNSISGVVPYQTGEVLWHGKRLPRVVHQVAREGIIQVPEGRRVFANLTVEQNLHVGAYLEKDPSKSAKRLQAVYELFPRLMERCQQYAGTLSGGEQQMLALGRALMVGPKLLLIDEPSLGLAPLLATQVLNHIAQVCREQQIPVLLVEQNARKALAVADYAYLLENGRVVGEGTGVQLLNDPAVQEAYLGVRRGNHA